MKLTQLLSVFTLGLSVYVQMITPSLGSVKMADRLHPSPVQLQNEYRVSLLTKQFEGKKLTIILQSLEDHAAVEKTLGGGLTPTGKDQTEPSLYRPYQWAVNSISVLNPTLNWSFSSAPPSRRIHFNEPLTVASATSLYTATQLAGYAMKTEFGDKYYYSVSRHQHSDQKEDPSKEIAREIDQRRLDFKRSSPNMVHIELMTQKWIKSVLLLLTADSYGYHHEWVDHI